MVGVLLYVHDTGKHNAILRSSFSRRCSRSFAGEEENHAMMMVVNVTWPPHTHNCMQCRDFKFSFIVASIVNKYVVASH